MRIFLASPHSYPGMIAECIRGGTGQIFINYGDKVAMQIFMEGGVSGNLKPLWSDTAEKIASGESFRKAVEGSMQIFLAGGHINGKYQQVKDYAEIEEYHPYILESFYYCDNCTEQLIPFFGDFLLDSGAFTFIQNKGTVLDWNEYIERYAAFINRNNISKYFELDIDSVVGYDKVKDFRTKLEKLTNLPCIPVWHPSRGTDEYKRLCDEYSYIAIGGVVIKEISKKQYAAFPSMIAEAHKKRTKVHGLGFTNLSHLIKCHFDSVDSTAWTTGNRFGFIYYFDGKTMRKVNAPPGHRLKDSRAVALNNYTEWIKFQKYADKYL